MVTSTCTEPPTELTAAVTAPVMVGATANAALFDSTGSVGVTGGAPAGGPVTTVSSTWTVCAPATMIGGRATTICVSVALTTVLAGAPSSKTAELTPPERFTPVTTSWSETVSGRRGPADDAADSMNGCSSGMPATWNRRT